jgi:lipopolysaccharide transport system ATP-binding protein
VNDVVISAENLGKRYDIGGARVDGAGYVTLRDTLARKARDIGRATLGRARGGLEPKPTLSGSFWALSHVDFEIKRGEVVGVLGRNGAGKSTLLKILSRITEPTEGRAVVRGRVASLLEVGTGFHPELTGRENIFLNGAILGMSRAEIKARFDEIVAFAEVERFLETPVKRFSSGMYVRLAFAVAAHLEAEILILDEVLAVGDAEFQRKCLGKMGDVAGGGRTVLLVSHNLAIIEQVCGSALLLTAGGVGARGPTASVVRRYLDDALRPGGGKDGYRYRNKGTALTIERVDFLVDGVASMHVGAGDRCEFVVRFRRDLSVPTRFAPVFLLSLYLNGQKVASLWTGFIAETTVSAEATTIRCAVPKWPLRDGRVRVDLYTHVGPQVEDWIEEVLILESRDGPFFGGGPLMPGGEGFMYIDHRWT